MQSDTKIPNLDVWEVFKLAAVRDDIKLAKGAIAALDTAGLTNKILFQEGKGTESLARFEGVPLRYVYRLLMSRFEREDLYTYDGDDVTAYVPRKSKRIAAVFKVD
jgi:hypothetical protein